MEPSPFDLSGRVAVVTGAAGHLGRPIALGLARAGARVYAVGRTAASLDALVADLRAEGLDAEASVLDLSDETAVRDFPARLGDRLDVLVNNAYSGTGGTLATMGPEDYATTYRLNVTMTALLCQVCRPALLAGAAATGSASVVNMASMYGMVSPDPGIYVDSGMNNPPNYGPAKAALIQLTRYLACHWAPDSIRVNSVSPGPFPPASVAERHPEFHRRLSTKVPMGRIGRAEEVVGAVVFLASGAASFITGVNLPVDGGWTAW